MKKFISGLLVGAIVASGGWVSAENIGVTFSKFKIVVDGIDKTPPGNMYTQDGVSVPATIVYNDRTYVPLRMAANLVGKPVRWNGATESIILGGPTQQTPITSLVPVDMTKGIKAGKSFVLDGRTYDKGILFYSFYSGETLAYNLNGQYNTFSLTLGYPERLSDSDFYYDNFTIQIKGDGNLLWQGAFAEGLDPNRLNLDVSSVKKLEIVSKDSGSWKLGIVDAYFTSPQN